MTGRRTGMTGAWRALGMVVLTVGTAIPAGSWGLATWRQLEVEPAGAEIAELLPAVAHLVETRSGYLLCLTGGSRPTVGLLWRSGDAFAFIDGIDRLVADRVAWRYIVPLAAHE